MKTNFVKSILIMAMAAGSLTGCVNDDDYSVPTLECNEPSMTATKTVQAIYDQATASATLYQSADPNNPDIIEAVVVSSDKGGNFYKTLYLNNIVTNGEGELAAGEIGFSLQINQADLFTDYGLGRKVYINLEGLYTQIRSNTLQIGALYNGNVGQIPAELYEAQITRSCTIIPEENLINVVTDLSQINDDYIGRLIQFQGVQFTDASLNQTYFNASNVDGGGQTLTYITDSEEETLTIPFRTSEYADYAGIEISSNSGTITGILTKFSTTYQFVSRYEADINLTEERIGGEPVIIPGESENVLGGTDITFSGSFVIDFEGYDVDENTFPEYINDNTVGERYWVLNQFPSNTGNKYIQMTSYNGSSNPGVNAKTYFMVPVDFSVANTLSFDKEIRYMAGEALKVYYVTSDNYTARAVIDASTFVEITNEFTGLTYPASGTSQNSFTTAGTYNVPSSLTGTGFFVFEYTGSSDVTTTIQLDNITVN